MNLISTPKSPQERERVENAVVFISNELCHYFSLHSRVRRVINVDNELLFYLRHTAAHAGSTKSEKK